MSQTPVNQVSVDGGNVRLRTPLKQPCEWRNYKAVCLHQVAVNAWFGQNEKLVDWVNQQPLANILTCLGDGHAGVWNLIALFTPPERRREILDC